MITCRSLSRTRLSLEQVRICFCRNASRATVGKKIYKYPRLSSDQVIKHPNHKLKLDDELYNSLKGKVLYNCSVTRRNSSVRWYVRKQLLDRINSSNGSPSIPLSLKYKYGESVHEFDEYRNAVQDTSQNEQDEDISNDENDVNLPYNVAKPIEFRSDTNAQLDKDEGDEIKISDLRRQKFEQQTGNVKYV